MPILEICCETIEDVLAAKAGGANRVELCAALGVGGVTPSAGFLEMATDINGLRFHAIVRPRDGDFLYTQRERKAMLSDIDFFSNFGIDGIVVGALTPDGDIDTEFLRACVEEAKGCSITFHRAFDLCRDPERALEDVINYGCDRLLTSGQASTAEDGIPLLRKLVKQAAGRISIMPGCGVTPANAAHILQETGATEIHASASKSRQSAMRYHQSTVRMGNAVKDEYALRFTDEQLVRSIRESIDRLGA